MRDGLLAVVEHDAPQAGWLYQCHCNPIRFIMRCDFDIAALCDDRVDDLRISGLNTDKAA